jgi:hypothetical protein
MSLTRSKVVSSRWKPVSVLLVVLCGFVFVSDRGFAAVYGITDDAGSFVPKVTVTVKKKEILIDKKDPREKFDSISLIVNRKNNLLIRNVGLLKIRWISMEGKPGKPILFANPRYNPATRMYKDSMTRSRALRIIDGSTRDLFAGKDFSDLFKLRIDGRLCRSSESFYEKDRQIRFKSGRDISIDVDKTSVVFTKENYKKSVMINVDNRSGFKQTLGVSLPEKGLLFCQIRRKPEQTKVPRENWDRFTVEPDSGIFIVLIPERDPRQMAELNGKEITIKVWDGNRIRETRRIPIRTSPELTSAEPAPASGTPETGGETESPPAGETGGEQPEEKGESQPAGTAPAPVETSPEEGANSNAAAGAGIWIWVVLIFNLILLAALGAYGVFYLMPKVQVLQDRLAKNEMFIHGSREAIREELEELKEDILRQWHEKYPPE